LREVSDPQRFGVPVSTVTGSFELRKAQRTGVSLRRDWHPHVRRDGLDRIRRLRPSGRGELEIKDVNK
jgi:hypothetical protein